MRIILVAALATMMCAPAGLAQTAKEKPPQATASSQRQLSPAERALQGDASGIECSKSPCLSVNREREAATGSLTV